MQLTIHRGTQEIGGTCIEISSGESRILLDVGLPLFDAQKQLLDTRPFHYQSTEELLKAGIMPTVEGLTGGERLPDAILLSHAHLDHCGLLDRTSPQIPVYASSGTRKMMKAGSVFARQVELPRERFRKLIPELPTQIGNFRVTAYSVDHSIFGAVAILVEADGQSLLYSGDLRLHGRKTGMAKKLIAAFQNEKLDVLLMEGTHLGHAGGQRTTEYELEEEITRHIQKASSLVLASFSPQHVDRLVAFIRAAKKTGRTFVADVYTAFVLHLIVSETKVPIPGGEENWPVFVPAILWANESKQRMIKKKFPQFLRARIKIDEIIANPAKYVMIFRPSMLESDFGGKLPSGVVCLHSRWEGYLNQPDAMEMKQAIEVAEGQLMQVHVSGHIRIEDTLELIRQLSPTTIIPVHTFAPEKLAEHFPNVRLPNDREVFEIA